MQRGDAPKPVSLDLTGAKKLVLAVIDANDGTAGDNADWAGAAIVTAPGRRGRSASRAARGETAPPIAPSRPTRRLINYPRITGATPGRPFLFRDSGVRRGELTFSVRRTCRRTHARCEDRHHHRLAQQEGAPTSRLGWRPTAA